MNEKIEMRTEGRGGEEGKEEKNEKVERTRK